MTISLEEAKKLREEKLREEKLRNVKPQFFTSELVRLRSGGPAMTVSGDKSNPNLICRMWFSEALELQCGWFDPERLIAYQDDPA